MAGETPLRTEEKSLVEKLQARADRWQVWIDDDLEAEIGYLPDHMRYHQALDRAAAAEIERLTSKLKTVADLLDEGAYGMATDEARGA